MSNTIEPGDNAGIEAPQAKRKRTTAMKSKGAKKASRAKKPPANRRRIEATRKPK